MEKRLQMMRFALGLVLLGFAGSASAQLGTFTDSPACCQLTTSLIQDVVYGKDESREQRLLWDGTPANFHILIDTSGSMRELPQVVNSSHSEFFNITVNGCENPRLDAYATSRGWDPSIVYPVPDVGTGLGADTGFPNLFQDSKFYGYMYWTDSSSPPTQWNSKEQACQAQVPNWSTTNIAEYNRCLACLSTKGYYKLPGTSGRDAVPLENLNFMFWGRFLNFNPPKYVALKAMLKSILRDVRNVRVGLSTFSNNTPNTVLLKTQNPSCSQSALDPSAFDSQRASYISSINSLTFTTGTQLARSLLNLGYYFSSDDTVYRNVFGFGSNYSYPAAFRNDSLFSQNRSVCWGCQSPSVIIISDGEPTGDSFVSGLLTRFRALNGGPVYCPDSAPCGSGTTSGRDKGNDPINTGDDNANYYLDDVAQFLHTQDLQRSTPPIVGDFDTSGQQSLTVHTIALGFQSNFLQHTAEVGGGLYYSVNDGESLRQALYALVGAVATRQTRPSALASAGVNGQLTAQPASALVPRLTVPANPQTPWMGALYRFQLAEERQLGCDPLNPAWGDRNFDRDCDDTLLLDANGDWVGEDVSGQFVKQFTSIPAQPFWEAGQELKPTTGPTDRWQSRRIFTLIDTNADGKLDHQDTPVAFTEVNAPLLREYLGINQNASGCVELAARLGVASLSPNECARVIIRWYRGADALNPDPALRGQDRPFLLQDILHSVPISVEPPQSKASCAASPQCLPALFSGATPLQDGYTVPGQPGTVDAYSKYAFEAGDRDKLVLVGSNGGMLHAFLNGQSTGVDPATGQNLYDAGTGQELWAFIPPDLLPRLQANLGKHAQLMDGTAMVREVWLDGSEGQPADGRKQWQEYRTVAVIGTGRGGVHRFALDLTRVLGRDPGGSVQQPPDAAGDFLWMWPQACDPLSLQVGESFSNFAPQPPPIGPVALTPTADDALRVRAGTPPGGAVTPWLINDTPARERWVVALNGGYDPQNARGRGMALVDLASGHTVWSFFHGDSRGRAENLRYSLTAGLALADVGLAQGDGLGADQLFDTATVGDAGGQLWALRFWQPGEWDAASQQVSNWYAARSFRVANLGGRSTSAEALRGPFTQIATNWVQPDTGILRTFLGTGDSQNLTDPGTHCRLGNPRACAEQGCAVQSTLQVELGGSTAFTATTAWSNFAQASATSSQSVAGPSCAGARVTLSWNNDPANSCGVNHDGVTQYDCSGDPNTFSCREVVNTWADVANDQATSPYLQHFYGVWSYGGSASRMFNTESEAATFDAQLLTDAELVNVGQFDGAGTVPAGSEASAAPWDKGWYIAYPYPGNSERTGSAATLINGCLLWTTFQATSQSTPVCSPEGQNTARLYQADPLSGRASCASGFYEPNSGVWSRFVGSYTSVPLGAPAPLRRESPNALSTQAVLSAPAGSGTYGMPLVLTPVTQGPP
jgi:type IV pilus assembly protein PilY1